MFYPNESIEARDYNERQNNPAPELDEYKDNEERNDVEVEVKPEPKPKDPNDFNPKHVGDSK